jgi:DNA-directed RNA polymerase specialized sigma24 family protein
VSLADYRHRTARTSVTLEDFRAFLTSGGTRDWVFAIVKARVPHGDAHDLTQEALAEALKAFVSAPPAIDEALLGWIATIARRVVADFLKKRGRRRRYEGDMPEGNGASSEDGARESASSAANDDGEPGGDPGARGVVEPSYDPRQGSADDVDLESDSLLHWLEGQVAGSPTDRETFEILLEHGLGKKTYQTIADERGITLTALSSRIFEFRKKYIERHRRERNRIWLLLLLFGAAVVVLVAWLLSRRDEPPGGAIAPPDTPVLDRVLGRPLPVSHPRPDDLIEPDAGAGAPQP